MSDSDVSFGVDSSLKATDRVTMAAPAGAAATADMDDSVESTVDFSTQLFYVVSKAGGPSNSCLGWRRQVLSVQMPRSFLDDSCIEDRCADILYGDVVKYVVMLLVPGWDAVQTHVEIVECLVYAQTPVLFVTWHDRDEDWKHPLLSELEKMGSIAVKHGTQSVCDIDLVAATELYAQLWYQRALNDGATKYFEWVLAQSAQKERISDTAPPAFPSSDRHIRMLLQAQKETLCMLAARAKQPLASTVDGLIMPMEEQMHEVVLSPWSPNTMEVIETSVLDL